MLGQTMPGRVISGHIISVHVRLCQVMSYHITGCPLWLEKLEVLEKLEKEPFSEFGWKSWKIIGFSHALAGKGGILFLNEK